MFYLLLAIICSASIALIFKYTETRQTNRYVITSANYFIAFTTTIVMMMTKGLLNDFSLDVDFLSAFSAVVNSDNVLLSPASSILWALMIGSVAGVFFFLSFLYYQKSVRENGVGLSGTIAKLGILIPMIFSIIIWQELPTMIQWIGIVLALISILIVNLSPESLERFDLKPTLLLLFVFGGIAEFSNKIYQKYALNDYKDVFLFAIFFIAFIISTTYAYKKQGDLRKRDIITGFLVGIPNLFSSYFLILALDTLKTSVVFPIYSAGSIVLITIGGFVLFNETIKRKNKVAIALTIVALILINL
ncbi:multidrug transporter EmrE-like cation transporter [Streptohalobacillus salinus]|uniref:Multidrug transporter EmrE-like cation transporter n=1 Tax=Streptohalobacillus salinus TaxID=621096 RepID=A0A2V3WF96_9BACI|nr:SMR family transporter [Streptohalobacillus salinus]PXW91811.1 multidrug transporter EmrE-like cation transporter [Streptohalobacillus salinus]